MKNFQILALVLIIILLGGVGYVLFGRGPVEAPTLSESVNQNGDLNDGGNMDEGKQEMGSLDGSRYVAYTPEELENGSGSRRVLFFYANWCPTCRPANKQFSENESQIPQDVIVYRVNYNDDETDQAEKDLARQYTVTYQHTYVQIDSKGNEVTKWNGGGLDELLRNLQ